MILYGFLKWMYDIAIEMPIIIWVIAAGVLIFLGIIGLSNIRDMILRVVFLPIGLYLICYICEQFQPIRFLGIACIIVRLTVDYIIIRGVVDLIKYVFLGFGGSK